MTDLMVQPHQCTARAKSTSKRPLTRQEQARQAMLRLQQHRLMTNGQIKAALEKTLERVRNRGKWLVVGQALSVLVVLALLPSTFFFNEWMLSVRSELSLSAQGAGMVVAAVSFVVIASFMVGAMYMGQKRAWDKRKAAGLEQAIVDLARGDYDSYDLSDAFKESGIGSGDARSMRPLAKDSEFWKHIHEDFGDMPELIRVWEGWVASGLPIRHFDIDLLGRAAFMVWVGKEELGDVEP